MCVVCGLALIVDSIDCRSNRSTDIVSIQTTIETKRRPSIARPIHILSTTAVIGIGEQGNRNNGNEFESCLECLCLVYVVACCSSSPASQSTHKYIRGAIRLSSNDFHDISLLWAYDCMSLGVRTTECFRRIEAADRQRQLRVTEAVDSDI